MNIKDLPLNDEYSQYIRSLNITTENAALKKEKMLSCRHLFVKIKERKSLLIDETYSSIDIECIYCGLTNKYRLLEDFFRIKQKAEFPYSNKTLETEVYEEIFKDIDLSIVNLISDEVLETHHPSLLYQLAKTINPSANPNELFTIMKELNDLETEQEKLRLKKYNQATLLLKRYQNTKTKILTKSKK